jgi:histidine triad (HIT) family protein
MACLFCQIAAKTAAADLVYEDALAAAFLDHRPLFPGHVLLIPRRHVTTLAELAPDEVGPFFQLAQRLELAVEAAMQADGSFIAINNKVSQSVPHLHVHVVPRRKKDGLKGFFWPRYPYRDDAYREEVAAAIRERLAR